TLGGRVAIGARLGHRLDQLVDDVLGGGHVRVAHPQIYDVGTAGPRRGLEAVHFGEDVGPQGRDARELFDRVTDRGGLLTRAVEQCAGGVTCWSRSPWRPRSGGFGPWRSSRRPYPVARPCRALSAAAW